MESFREVVHACANDPPEKPADTDGRDGARELFHRGVWPADDDRAGENDDGDGTFAMQCGGAAQPERHEPAEAREIQELRKQWHAGAVCEQEQDMRGDDEEDRVQEHRRAAHYCCPFAKRISALLYSIS